MIIVVLFFIFYLVAVAFEQKDYKSKYALLAIACTVLTFFAGFRSLEWADTGVYALSFMHSTPSISDFSFSDRPSGYSEKGFYLIQVICKTLIDDYHFFFVIIAGLSFIFLYKDFKQYSIFPLIGLCVYISRFYLGRNFMQIRAGLAYAILMLSIKYILEKDWKRYFFIVFIAWTIHRSCIIAIPLYFICNWINVKKWHVIVALAISFAIGIWGQGFMHTLVVDNASDINIGDKYVTAERGQIEGLGMRNPMIYFQSFILIAYTFLEKRLAPVNKYYHILRIAYLYSTMILICFCSFKVLSARSSSMYATLEFVIIPSLIYMFNKRNRLFAFLITGFVLSAIFYMYLQR